MKIEENASISRYRILSKIGKGGMGDVFLAEDTKLDRSVALKILPAEFAGDPERMARFVREAKSASALNHPNIITIYEIDESDGTHFIATEFIDGETLSEYSQQRRLSLQQSVEIAIQVASALDEAHSAGIVHRDIKPENIMVRENGLVKILDFGIAKLSEAPTATDKVGTDPEAATAIQSGTTPGMIIGTANYMSPEQARGREVDARTDLFSFGVVLYEMLSGEQPFSGDTVSDTLAAVLMKEPKRLENIPPTLEAIVSETLQKDKNERYETAKELLDDLKKFKQELAVQKHLERTSSPNLQDQQTQILPTPKTGAGESSSSTGSEEGFRVVVLPFKFRGANAEVESLADGLSEEIVTGLSRFPYLRLITRSAALRGEVVTDERRTTSEQFGVRYVLEGSLRQVGTTVRIAVQLVDMATGEHLWAETYDRQLEAERILEIQDELVSRVVSTIADWHGVLVHSMAGSLRTKDKKKITPDEAVLYVFGYIERLSQEEHFAARELVERIVKEFPDKGNCWAMLAILYCNEYMYGFNLRPDPLGRALTAAQRAVELEPANYLASQSLAFAYFFRREFAAFESMAMRTIALNRMCGGTVAVLGLFFACSGEWERGCELSREAMELNPHFPGWYRLPFVFNAYRQKNYREALDEAQNINIPNYFWTLVMKTAALGQLGETEKAKEALNELLASRPDIAGREPEEFGHWLDAEFVEDLMEGLRNAGFETTSAKSQEEQKTSTHTVRTTAEDMPPSIAVLPFTNISAEEDNEYFCDGLAEELINALSKIEGLKVAARTSAFSFKGKKTNVSEIGEKLSVKNVLEGSVRRSGNKIRISVQLVDALDGYQIWSERYDREIKDIFDVQDEIALSVVDTLKLQLFGDEKAAVLKRYTNNPEAYQLYLKGRFYFDKFTVEGFEKSVEYYKQALAKEPDYAPAYAALSKSFNYAAYVGIDETEKCLSEAKAAVEKALALDQTLAEAYHSLALIKFNFEQDWTEAEKAFRRAIELNHSENHEHYSMFLAVLERSDEAVVEAKRTAELTPLAFLPNYIAGWGFWFAGRSDLARDQGEKLLEMEPNFSGGHVLLGMKWWNDGEYPKAIDKLETAVNLGAGNDIKMLLGLLYGMVGEREKADLFLTDFQGLDDKGIFTASQQAFVYAGLDEMDRAFELLETAVERQEGTLPFLKKFSSLYPKFHHDPRMTAVLSRIGLPTDKTDKPEESPEASSVKLQPDTADESANFEQIFESTANPKSETQDPKSKWWLFGLLVLLVLVGGFFGYKYLSQTESQIDSIAVLPFVNESSDADSDYLSDGLSESLIYRLSQISDLKVSPTNSVIRYKGINADVQKIASELGVRSVLTGRLTQRGENLTISVELIDAVNNRILWGHQYERGLSDLLETQREIATEITSKLKLKLSGESEKILAKGYTKDNEAYQLYLKGRFYWNKRTTENIKKSIDEFKAAVEEDPNFALAYNGMADAYVVLVYYTRGSEYDQLQKAKGYALRALEIDDSLAEAHATLGLIHNFLWEPAEAENAFKRSIELNPEYATVRHWYSRYLRSQRRKEEGLNQIKKAHDLDRLSLPISGNYAESMLETGDLNGALVQGKKTLEIDPDYWAAHQVISYAYLKLGKKSEALAHAQEAAENLNRESVTLFHLGYVHAVLGNTKEAGAILKELEQRYAENEASGRDVAAVYVGLGDKDKAFEWLEKDFRTRASSLTYLLLEVPFEELAKDPRFADLKRRMGWPLK